MCAFFVLHFQIHLDAIAESTGKIMVFVKQYYFKLCQKGLLERGLTVGKIFDGNISLENKVIWSMAKQERNTQEMLKELRTEKEAEVRKKIGRIKFEMGNLDKTIRNMKHEMQKSMAEQCYLKWSSLITESSMEFKKHFSEEFNRLFDHLYQNDEKFEKTVGKIKEKTTNIIDQISVHLMEEDLKNEFLKENLITDNSSNEKRMLQEGLAIDNPTNGKRLLEPNDSGLGDSFNASLSEPSLKKKKREKGNLEPDYEILDEVGTVNLEEFEASMMENL